MNTLLAIDPGPVESAWVIWTGGTRISSFRQECNEKVLSLLAAESQLRSSSGSFIDHVAIEMIASYGMAVGAEIFETCVWIGRFMEAFGAERCSRLPRLAVKQHLCHDSRAKDANIRAALIDRFGGAQAIRKGGPLYKVSGDCWSALAVGVTYWDQQQAKGAAA